MWIKKIDDEILNLLHRMKYRAVVVENLDCNKPITRGNIVIVKKIVIETDSRKELKKSLKNIKRERNIVSVKPKSVEASRMAAHDTRVDTIILDENTVYYMDKQQFSLMKQYSKPIEIPLNTFYSSIDSSLKSMIYRRVKYYLYYTKQPLIIFCSAGGCYALMSPEIAVSLLSHILVIEKRVSV
ncbi:MAG: RNase P subunit p30, partial [Desulfurococcaceae archaeon]